jgi:cell division control protein 6
VGNIISELDMQGLINAKIVSLGRQGRTRYINLEMDKRQIESILEEDDFLSEIIEGMKESRYFSSMQLRLI